MSDTVIKINKQTCKARTIQDWYFRAGPNTVVKTGGQNIVSHVEKKSVIGMRDLGQNGLLKLPETCVGILESFLTIHWLCCV